MLNLVRGCGEPKEWHHYERYPGQDPLEKPQHGPLHVAILMTIQRILLFVVPAPQRVGNEMVATLVTAPRSNANDAADYLAMGHGEE